MKILGFNISIKRQPGPGSRLAVIEESLASHKQFLEAIADRLVQVEKKAEATRRKVYRDGEEPAPDTTPQEPAPLKFEDLQPGDIVPPGVNL
ncbi:hypothetical protein ES708_19777 [subsurface metagenome]